MATIFPLFLGKIGAPEIIVIVVLFLLLFGGKKIPEMMRGMGRGIKEFKDAVNKDYSDDKGASKKEEKKEEPKETKEIKE